MWKEGRPAAQKWLANESVVAIRVKAGKNSSFLPTKRRQEEKKEKKKNRKTGCQVFSILSFASESLLLTLFLDGWRTTFPFFLPVLSVSLSTHTDSQTGGPNALKPDVISCKRLTRNLSPSAMR